MSAPAIICLTGDGLLLARRLQARLPGAVVHGLATRVEGADVPFAGATDHIARLFHARTPIIGICAAGILIRAVAPLLSDKFAEPPVIAVAADGSCVVPLLGGHHGANRLARRVGDILDVAASVTTASDLGAIDALDDPPPGWIVANSERAKSIAAARLAGQTPKLKVEAGGAAWLGEGWVSVDRDADVLVTDRRQPTDSKALILHPPVLALGVGCERGADAEELIALVEACLVEAGLARESVGLVASLDLKSDEPAVHALAAWLDRPARFFDAATLEAETPRLATPSKTVFREVGCHGVSEGAALAAVGPEGALIVPKRKSARATCAIARSPRDLDPTKIGRARGRLAIIGIGPGPAEWRTAEATAELASAEVVVGYRLYLDLVADLIGHAETEDSGLGAETERVERALDRAAQGRRVALISSGDAGIYGLATLAFERLEHGGRADWRRVEVLVAPGVSAFQAAAARLGAPMGHDFCLISLSDLMTPWPAIERRVRAAADGDFVIAFYNPRSERRTEQLVAALAILRAQRPAETPVALARQLGREGETITLTTLGALDPAAVDMLTLVVIGASSTRSLSLGGGTRLYTPRGYGDRG